MRKFPAIRPSPTRAPAVLLVSRARPTSSLDPRLPASNVTEQGLCDTHSAGIPRDDDVPLTTTAGMLETRGRRLETMRFQAY